MPHTKMKNVTGAKHGGSKGPIKREGQAKLPSSTLDNVKGSSSMGKATKGRKRGSY